MNEWVMGWGTGAGPTCCALASDTEAMLACCDPNAFFFSDACLPYEEKDITCTEDATITIESQLLADCPWLRWDWAIDCVNPMALAVGAVEEDGETCGPLRMPLGFAEFDAEIDPAQSYLSVVWPDSTLSSSSLGGNLMAASSPNVWMTGIAWGSTAATPDGVLVDPVLFFDGSIAMGSGSTSHAFTVPSAQGYSIVVQGLLNGSEVAIEIVPDRDAVGEFDASAGFWWLHSAGNLGDGTAFELHLEGNLRVVSAL